MREQRLTQDDLADELGISQQAVSRRLSGDVEFTAGELEKIASFLDVPVAKFFGEARAS